MFVHSLDGREVLGHSSGHSTALGATHQKAAAATGSIGTMLAAAATMVASTFKACFERKRALVRLQQACYPAQQHTAGDLLQPCCQLWQESAGHCSVLCCCLSKARLPCCSCCVQLQPTKPAAAAAPATAAVREPLLTAELMLQQQHPTSMKADVQCQATRRLRKADIPYQQPVPGCDNSSSGLVMPVFPAALSPSGRHQAWPLPGYVTRHSRQPGGVRPAAPAAAAAAGVSAVTAAGCVLATAQAAPAAATSLQPEKTSRARTAGASEAVMMVQHHRGYSIAVWEA